MIVIVIALGACLLMYSERLGIPVDLGAAGFRAHDMSNWGLMIATVAGLWLAFGPGSGGSKSKGKG